MVSNPEPPHSVNSAQTWECLPATSHSVDQIAFSSDGKILASYYGKSAEAVKLWDVASGQQLYAAKWVNLFELAGGDEGLDLLGCESLFFSSDGKALTFGGFIWDLELGQVINVRTLNSPFKPEYDRGIAVSPDLQKAVTAYRGYGGSENNVGTMKLWETSTGKEIYTLFLGRNVDSGNIYVNQFSPDGKIFASLIWFRHGSDFYPGRLGEEKIKLWEVKTGMELCSIPLPDVDASTKYAGVFAFSSDSRILASNCGDTWRRVIVLSETATGKELCRFQGLGSQGFVGLDKVVSLVFSPDDQLLASGDSTGRITLWQLNKGRSKSLTTRKIRTFIGNVSNEPIRTLAFSPDGRVLASGAGDNDGGITLWEVKSGKKLKTFPGHSVSTHRVCSNSFVDRDQVAVSSDGKTIASIDDSHDMIKLWDTQSGAFLRCLKYKSHRFAIWRKVVNIGKLAFSQDGKFLVGVHDSGASHITQSKIVIWEVATGREIQSIQYHGQGVWGSRTVNQYGELLAVVEQPTNVHSRKLRIKVLQVRTGRTICTLTGDYGFTCQIIFSPDKQLVATRHSMSEFAIWEIATGRLIRTINSENSEGDTDPGDPDPVLFSPDGEILAIAGTQNITLWQVSSGEKIRTINRYHQGWGSCLAFSPNGQTLAFTEYSGGYGIKLLDVKTGSETCILEHTFRRIISLDFSGNGQVLVSSYRDGTIAVWQQK
jgi:WD40 repeat protein